MKIIITIFIIFVILAGGLYFTRNYLVASAVEEGSSYALGVDTRLGSAGLDIGGGSLSLKDFEVPNPDGFKQDNFLKIGTAVIDINEGSVFDDHVVIDSFVIEGIELNIEQIDDNGNYKVLLDHLNGLKFSESSESNRTYQVKKAAVRGFSVTASLSLAGKEISSQAYTVENFTMTDVGGTKGLSVAEVSALLFKRIISKATVNNQTFLKFNTGQLKDSTKEKVDELKEDASDKVKELGKSIIGGK